MQPTGPLCASGTPLMVSRYLLSLLSGDQGFCVVSWEWEMVVSLKIPIAATFKIMTAIYNQQLFYMDMKSLCILVCSARMSVKLCESTPSRKIRI